MRELLITDTHFHFFEPFSYITPKGVNSRFALQIEAFEEALYFGLKNDCSVVKHLGDVFERRGLVETEIINTVKNSIKKFSKYDEFILLTGNHDIINEGDNSNNAKIFNEWSKVKTIDHPCWYTDKDGVTSVYIPFSKDINEIEAYIKEVNKVGGKQILYTHNSIIGFVYNGYALKKGIQTRVLSKFKKVFNGHIHQPSQKGNVHCIGAPYPMRFDDNTERHVTIYDRSTDKIIRLQVKHPKFISVSKREDIKEDGNFYRFLSEDTTPIKGVKVVPIIKKNKNVRVSGDTPQGMIKNYCINLESESYIKSGLEYYKKVNRVNVDSGVLKTDIELLSLSATNFMQYSNLTEFNFDKIGINHIIGKNRAGKSSIFEMIYWCITGTTARDSTEVVKKGTSSAIVKLSLKIRNEIYNITRSLGKNKHTLVVSNKEKDYDAGVNLTQQYLYDLLNTNKDTLLFAMLFGHNSFRFSKAKDSERKAVLQDIPMLDFSKFINARDLVRNEQIQIQGKINNYKDYIIPQKQKFVDDLKEKKDKIEVKAVNAAKVRIEEYKNSIVTLNADIKKLKLMKEEDYNALSELVDKLEDDSIVIQSKYEDFKELYTAGATKCPTCNQDISKNTLKANYRYYKDQAEHILNKLNAEKEKIKKEDEKRIRLGNLEDDISLLKESISDDEDIVNKKSTDTSTKDMQSIISKYNREIAKCNVELKALEVKLEELNFWYKGFGNSGIVSYLTDQFLNKLNEELLDISVKCTDGSIAVQYFPDTETKKGSKSEKISIKCFLDGIDHNYNDLSNSERQRVDLITMFGFKRIYNEYLNINTVWFDEVFEGLDEESSDMMINFLEQEFADSNCFVMTHSKDVNFKIENVIRVDRNEKGSFIV